MNIVYRMDMYGRYMIPDFNGGSFSVHHFWGISHYLPKWGKGI